PPPAPYTTLFRSSASGFARGGASSPRRWPSWRSSWPWRPGRRRDVPPWWSRWSSPWSSWCSASPGAAGASRARPRRSSSASSTSTGWSAASSPTAATGRAEPGRRPSGPLGDPAAADLGARDVEPELVLREGLEEVLEAVGHGHVRERAERAAGLAAGHQEAAPTRPYRLQRGEHRGRVALVEARVHHTLGRVDADDEHAAGEELGLLREQRRTREGDLRPAGELERPLARHDQVDWRLGRVDERQLEQRRQAGVARRRLGEAPVALVHGVERPREHGARTDVAARRHAPLRGHEREPAVPPRDGLERLGRAVLQAQLLAARERQGRRAEDTAGVGDRVED